MRHIRRDAHAVALLEDLPGRYWLSVNADQVIGRLAVGDSLGEEPFDGRTLGDFDVIGKTRPIVVDEQYEHVHYSF
jgi:hypothetical protein